MEQERRVRRMKERVEKVLKGRTKVGEYWEIYSQSVDCNRASR